MSEPTIPQIIPIKNKRVKDMAGQRFGSLAVIGFVGSVKIGAGKTVRAYWLCACDCGRQLAIDGANLRSGNTKNCGCQKVERFRELGKRGTHGMKKSPEYRAWNGMKARCTNPSNAAYHKYGGRGISVCQRWHDSFENFFADMGLRPTPNHSVDRIDNNGDYSPENCRWATRKEQMNKTDARVR